jgi:hypothetical protein
MQVSSFIPLAKRLLGQETGIRNVFKAYTTKTHFRPGLIKSLDVARMNDLCRFTIVVDSL